MASLNIGTADANIVAAQWNGQPVLFVDYGAGTGDDEERRLVAVQRDAKGRLVTTAVTTGEPEGGAAEIAAIGFANADRDPARELVVIIKWPQQHYDFDGYLYEVRLFDNWKSGQGELLPLTKLSRHFGGACDCDWRDGSHNRFRFKTIAAIKKELKRLRF